EPERWPHNLKRRRGATRLRRGASERWGPGGHSGPPRSSIPPDHLTQRGAEILPHAFEVRMDRQRSPKALGGFAVLVERPVPKPLAGQRPEVIRIAGHGLAAIRDRPSIVLRQEPDRCALVPALGQA